MVKIIFSGEYVGLIVRGKTGPDHHPDKLDQHADCILSDGSCIGFFGEGRDGSGGSGGSVGLNMRGTAYDMDGLAKHRPYYTNGAIAKTYGVISGVLVLGVGTAKAQAFDAAWAGLKANPPTFWIVGANCSTRASGAFRSAGILDSGIPGLDTPDNLFGQLATTHAASSWSYFGYVGFERRNAGYVVSVEGA